jgi:hypothetical protein
VVNEKAVPSLYVVGPPTIFLTSGISTVEGFDVFQGLGQQVLFASIFCPPRLCPDCVDSIPALVVEMTKWDDLVIARALSHAFPFPYVVDAGRI